MSTAWASVRPAAGRWKKGEVGEQKKLVMMPAFHLALPILLFFNFLSLSFLNSLKTFELLRRFGFKKR